jgi:hypothetical protein
MDGKASIQVPRQSPPSPEVVCGASLRLASFPSGILKICYFPECFPFDSIFRITAFRTFAMQCKASSKNPDSARA